MKSILISILLLFPLYSYSQYFYLYGDKTFGGNMNEFSGNIVAGENMTLILAGNSFTNINGDKTTPLCNSALTNLTDGWFLKIDTTLNIIWQKDIGGDHIEDEFYILKSNIQSQTLFGCRSSSDSSCEKSGNNRSYPNGNSMNYWMAALDSSGNKILDKTYGPDIGAQSAAKITMLKSGDYIIGGMCNAGVNGDKTVSNYGGKDYWLLKLDSLGNKVWDQVYGGSGDEIAGAGYTGEQFDILSNDDGTFLLGGTTSSPISGNISDSCRGLNDIWIIKIDTAGNKIWDHRFGGDQNDYLYDIDSTKDGGYVLCGFTSSTQGGEVSQPSQGYRDFWVVKVDSLGNKMWDKRFGGTGEEIAGHIEQDFDGGYWVGGKLTSGAGGDVSEPAYGATDYWILKLDSAGNKVWDKRFGGPGDNILTSFAILADSSIMLFGYADSGSSVVKTDAGKGGSDYWLVHFYYGNNPPVGISENANMQGVSIYPNPATTEITISFASNDEKTVTISDVSGKVISQTKIQKTETIDISKFSPGVYLCKVTDKNKNTYVSKILKY